MVGIHHIQLLGMSHGSNSHVMVKRKCSISSHPMLEGNTGTTSASQNGQSFEKVSTVAILNSRDPCRKRNVLQGMEMFSGALLSPILA